MIFYLDTSVMVAAFVPEAHTARVQNWLAIRAHDDFAISEWGATEFSSALSVKLRTGQIGLAQRAAALAAFADARAETMETLAVSTLEFRAAARFADRYASGLRAGDALHLAICAEHGATLCTLDRRLADAGPELGIKTLSL